MSKREQIEMILRKHGIIYVNPRNTYIDTDERNKNMKVFLDDLLSLFPEPSLCPNCGKNPPTYCFTCWERLPTPSLKTLERIFELHDHKYGSKAEWLKAIQYDILKWANGNWSELKVWCSHLTHDSIGWKREQKGYVGYVPDDWTVCPICGAKKPGGETQ